MPPSVPSLMHAAEQPSPEAVLPSSHCSTPARTKPSPHLASAHPMTHASVLLLLPSSHASLPCTTPSPQVGSLQLFEQPSPSFALPSSHSSTPARTKPSPHFAATHPVTHASVLLVL